MNQGSRIRGKTPDIRRFILTRVDAHPHDIAGRAAAEFGITRQAANRHLANLIDAGLLNASGRTRARRYGLRTLKNEVFSLPLPDQDESLVWRDRVLPVLADNPDNVRQICSYGFTEMLNNAIDHSEGSEALIAVTENAAWVKLMIADNGVGIFNKIKAHFGFDDERQALLELSKGKLTTAPERHSGQGIFFTSHMFDSFGIFSGHFTYMWKGRDPSSLPDLVGVRRGEGWLVDGGPSAETKGTTVFMDISRFSRRTSKEVFDTYSSDDETYDFSRTHVSLELSQYEGGELVSRSQAKRLMARVDSFREAILDFKGVESIGQAFADELFRVYQRTHPNMRLIPMNANDDVQRMIRRAQAEGKPDGGGTGSP